MDGAENRLRCRPARCTMADLPEYVIVATDAAGEVAAKGFSVPFALHGKGRPGELPDRGWDQVMQWAFSDLRSGAERDTVSAIEKVASASMAVSGALAQWRGWTGLPFEKEGPVEVPGALVPVHCEPEHDYAAYVEPNVWVLHAL